MLVSQRGLLFQKRNIVEKKIKRSPMVTFFIVINFDIYLYIKIIFLHLWTYPRFIHKLIMKKLFLPFIFLVNISNAQFKVIVDETFSLKIQAAIDLIKESDATSFVLVSDYCDKILISADTIPKSDDGIINIPLRTVGAPSINLLASTIVRESYKLRLDEVAQQLNQKERDLLCHEYEIIFQKKLPKEYGNTMKERIRKIVDSLKNDPFNQKN
jgi:hypothetical protein